MKILSLTMLIILSVNINSCKSKKIMSSEDKKVEIKKTNFIEEGYSKASIVFDANKSETCQYLIQLEKGALLEPREFTSNDFKVNNKLVWIKFLRQRRMSRCGSAQPVELLDIIERK